MEIEDSSRSIDFSRNGKCLVRVKSIEKYSWREVCRNWIESPMSKLIASEQSSAASVYAQYLVKSSFENVSICVRD